MVIAEKVDYLALDSIVGYWGRAFLGLRTEIPPGPHYYVLDVRHRRHIPWAYLRVASWPMTLFGDPDEGGQAPIRLGTMVVPRLWFLIKATIPSSGTALLKCAY